MNTFSKLVKCKLCNKTMKFKKESGGLYCCSTYDNYGKEHCQRTIVREEVLRELIERRHRREMTDQEIRDIVDYVIVESHLLMEIHFSNGDIPILLKGHHIQF
ncbi:recombinase zinc beta ribbon domain-containing protein [Cytobacillus praedii]|uniref:Recombinase zinc beta ribbon domain-containing protein n=1 Tax=Cytobacillus praedii TaxID=1742358 RepID=A0A4R1AWV6_9BACI|nr:recombinase zinc beta ribbon domain-containing protein [Cytobacillus praedii]TCJ01607.1 hypothetical protein E0Y62_23235 [Cytobacillus praedii]